MSAFAQGFVTTRYLLGVRGDALARDLECAPYAAAGALVTALASEDRAARAHALASGIRQLLADIDARRTR